ncbi:MAG TPA: hypothetical protein VLI39_07500 [Sedimentisphaerales bacterium]|nr:hypothetical protein [Sedimentisphaerales bacterium]
MRPNGSRRRWATASCVCTTSPAQDYDFEASCAHRDGQFVGLALDADNQSDLTAPRIKEWVRQIRGELGL